jgi:hypothetical protein
MGPAHRRGSKVAARQWGGGGLHAGGCRGARICCEAHGGALGYTEDGLRDWRVGPTQQSVRGSVWTGDRWATRVRLKWAEGKSFFLAQNASMSFFSFFLDFSSSNF